MLGIGKFYWDGEYNDFFIGYGEFVKLGLVFMLGFCILNVDYGEGLGYYFDLVLLLYFIENL